ncbi:TolC family protein [Stieleria sp. JC731]|uniref:efflux transporter outer membrane subunit n=1 Tax=Pirellulaceae TaxID=2691357 RepID=UPI001E47B18C|nr:TolC family protein [Stieleria sp. JC731]MCC9603230.1 TolC family protein [Stieleria sp. JC731]
MKSLASLREGILVPWLVLVPVIGLLIGGGCAVKKQTAPVKFTPEAPPAFTGGGQVVPPDQWWVTFEDEGLNRQIDQLFDGSFTLATAIQRLNAARAVARREASDLFPDLNGVGSIGSTFGPGSDSTSYTWGLDASYQVDLWGRIESRVQAEQFRAAATHADYHAVALALTAEVATTWFSLIEANAQLALLDDQIETNQMGLLLQEASFGQGLIRSPDVLRQRQLVESTLEQSVVVKARIEVLEHQLAVLLGEMPQTAAYRTGRQLPGLPPMPDTGLPSELLCRRPDVRRDYLAFMAANKDLASAITDLYPRLNLTGSLLNSAEKPETLFRDWFLSIGGQLVAPLLDGGQRRAEIDRTNALVRQRFNEYGDTMLNAFREVEDSLAREKYQLERLTHLRAQTELAGQAAEQLREQYYISDADYLDVLSAITAEQRLQRETLTAQLELLLIRVSLYLALAGGFEPRPQIIIEIEDVTDSSESQIGPQEISQINGLQDGMNGQPMLEISAPGNANDFEELLKSVNRLPETDLDD